MINQLLAQLTNPVVSLPTSERGADALNHVVQTGITFALLAAAVIFLFMLIAGAISWITAGGDKGAIEDAKKRVINALIGIVVVFSVYALSTAVGKFFGVDMLVFSNATPVPSPTSTPGGTSSCTAIGQACTYGITQCCSPGSCTNPGGGFRCTGPTPTPTPTTAPGAPTCTVSGPTTVPDILPQTYTSTASDTTNNLQNLQIRLWKYDNSMPESTFANCSISGSSGSCTGTTANGNVGNGFDGPGLYRVGCYVSDTTFLYSHTYLDVTVLEPAPVTQIRVNNVSSYVTTATPDTNVDVTLSWTSTNATTCTASTSTTYPGSNWSGNVPGSGTRTSTIYADPANIGSTQTTSYTLTCTGPGGTSTNTATATLDVH